MTPAESIFPALNRIEAVGASVRLVDGKLQLFGDVQNVPADARATLRARSVDLVAYLTTAERPAPDWVLFVSRRLGTTELPAGWVAGVEVVWIGEQPHYRLTPIVAAWISRQVGALKSEQRRQGTEAAARLWAWVEAHYPPHQIAAAKSGRIDLPVPPKPPPSMPGADAWEVRTHMPKGSYGAAI